ncbi:hypothetical protein E0198_002405 [Clavispora lusitaniae]|nr:hypothetical protein E0198_002405 [Clavispora lusitaniae]
MILKYRQLTTAASLPGTKADRLSVRSVTDVPSPPVNWCRCLDNVVHFFQRTDVFSLHERNVNFTIHEWTVFTILQNGYCRVPVSAAEAHYDEAVNGMKQRSETQTPQLDRQVAGVSEALVFVSEALVFVLAANVFQALGREVQIAAAQLLLDAVAARWNLLGAFYPLSAAVGTPIARVLVRSSAFAVFALWVELLSPDMNYTRKY